MKTYLINTALSTLVVATVFSFEARATSSSQNDALRVDLPEARVIEPMRDLPTEASDQLTVEVGLSSWVPSNFSLPSNIATTSSFGRGDLPLIYLRTTSQLSILPGLKSDLGVNFVQLDRTGIVDNSQNGAPTTQTVDMISIRIGVEYAPIGMGNSKVQPYATLALLPSYLAASRSAFTTGTGYFGVPAEAGLGGRIKMKKLGIPWNAADFTLGVSATDGVIDGSNMTGFALNAGVRIVL